MIQIIKVKIFFKEIFLFILFQIINFYLFEDGSELIIKIFKFL